MKDKPNYSILVVEPDPNLAKDIFNHLTQDAFDALVSNSAEDGLEKLKEVAPDLMLVEWKLEDTQGDNMVRRVREESQVPLVVYGAESDSTSRIAALELGADDFLSKPIALPELSARLRAMMRRTGTHQPRHEQENVLEVGHVRLELTSCRVDVDGKVFTLTPNEFRLLAVLMRSPGEVFSREELREKVWPDVSHSLHLVEVHIANLRKKIEVNQHHPKYILTARSKGYKFYTQEG